MNRSSSRAILVVLLLLIAGGGVYVFVRESGSTEPTLETDLQRLQSTWAFRRREAAKDLARFGREADRVAPELLKAVRDPDSEVRTHALESLKQMGALPASAVAALTELALHGQDSTVRREAAGLLSSIRDPGVAVTLLQVLDDPDPMVRASAMSGLSLQRAWSKEPNAVGKVTAMLDPSQPDGVRLGAVQALSSVVQAQEPVARALVESLSRDSNPSVRSSITVVLRKSKHGIEIPALLAALEDQNPQVRLSAGASLAWTGLGDDRVVPALCAAVRKADDVTREGVGLNIAAIRWDPPAAGTPPERAKARYDTAVRELSSLLEKKETAGRDQVVLVLARLAASYQQSVHPALLEPARAALKCVLTHLLDEKEEVPLRLQALQQWELIQPWLTPPLRVQQGPEGGPAPRDELLARASWLDALARCLNSPTEAIRRRAAEYLVDSFKAKQAEDWYRDAWKKAVPHVVQAARGQDARVRAGALAILTQLGPLAHEAVPSLEALAGETSDEQVRRDAQAAIRSIRSPEALTAGDPASRAQAATTLGNLGWRAGAAIPALIKTLEDPEAKVRMAVVEALRSLGPGAADAVKPLIAALGRETQPEVRAMILKALDSTSKNGPAALEARLTAMDDPSPIVRRAAVSFQAVPTSDSIVAGLSKALADADPDVSAGAAGSLTRILYRSGAAIPALIKMMRDEKTRGIAFKALDDHFERASDRVDLGGVTQDLPGLRSTLHAIIPAIRDGLALKNNEINMRLIPLLGRTLALSRVTDSEVRGSLEKAAETLIGCMGSDSAEVRGEVVDRLGDVSIQRAAAIQAILKELERPDDQAANRAVAVDALARQAAATAANPEAHAALLPAVPLLVKLLEDADPDVSEAAVRALGSIGGDAATAADALLKVASSDTRPQVRKEAKRALEAITGVSKPPAASAPAGAAAGGAGPKVMQAP